MKTIIGSLILFSAAAVYIIAINKNNKQMTIRQKLLKAVYPVIMWAGKSKKQSHYNTNNIKPSVDFYSFKIELNDGTWLDFSTVKGKKIMLVNTASDCGFTAQYEALEKLYQQHKDSLIIIGFPANDFAQQEKKNDTEIAGFCKKNYGVEFPLAKKGVVIKNNNQQNIYKWLTEKSFNGWNEKAPSWNFCKYIIDENGILVCFLPSTVDPMGKEMKAALEFN
jgi:glutathione peroxidase